MAQEMRIDGAVRDGQGQPGNEKVFNLFPDLCGVGFFVFHGLVQSTQAHVCARGERDLGTTRAKGEVDCRPLPVNKLEKEKDLTQRPQSLEHRDPGEKSNGTRRGGCHYFIEALHISLGGQGFQPRRNSPAINGFSS